jgi:hypothetical protein
MEANEVATIIAAVSALIVAVSVAFGKIVSANKKQDRISSENIAKMNAQTIELLTKVVQENTDTQRQLVEETRRGTEAQVRTADEAKERNGHLAELQIKSQEMIDRNFEYYQSCFKSLKEQHVESQTVDKQIVKR